MPLFFNNMVLLLYFIISLGLLLLSFISIIIKNKKIDFICFLLVCMMMTSFYGFRTSGTVDTKMYLSVFEGLNSFANFSWGIGFYILMKTIKFIDDSDSGYILYSSFFIVFFFGLSFF